MKKDLSSKILMEYPDVFADAENVCLFHGRRVIDPENLELLPQEIHYKEDNGTIWEKRGDVRMRLKDNGIELAILHLEHPEAVIDMITAFAGKTEARQMANKVIMEQKKKGGQCTMYTILDYLEEEGIEKGRDQIIYGMFRNNKTPEDISDFTGEPLEYIYDVHQRYQATVKEKGGYDNEDRHGI